jgi:hypothetical protein
VQLVRFTCGGFALTIATTHLLVDGQTFALLMSALTEMVREGGFSRDPVFDRSLILCHGQLVGLLVEVMLGEGGGVV